MLRLGCTYGMYVAYVWPVLTWLAYAITTCYWHCLEPIAIEALSWLDFGFPELTWAIYWLARVVFGIYMMSMDATYGCSTAYMFGMYHWCLILDTCHWCLYMLCSSFLAWYLRLLCQWEHLVCLTDIEREVMLFEHFADTWDFGISYTWMLHGSCTDVLELLLTWAWALHSCEHTPICVRSWQWQVHFAQIDWGCASSLTNALVTCLGVCSGSWWLFGADLCPFMAGHVLAVISWLGAMIWSTVDSHSTLLSFITASI